MQRSVPAAFVITLTIVIPLNPLLPSRTNHRALPLGSTVNLPLLLPSFFPSLLPLLNSTLLFRELLDEKERSSPFRLALPTLFTRLPFADIVRSCYSKSCAELKGSSRSSYAVRLCALCPRSDSSFFLSSATRACLLLHSC